ncbi:MAG: molybdopterin-dependent oxidoreductase [Chloroflexota bacterium]|nr:molybdopterin-dependent oxidoreductase [Chloroflexota bacterium]
MRRVIVQSACAGLVAALAMTGLLLLLRATLGVATPSEMVGDRLTAFISIKQFFSLLDQFGGYSGLKQAGGGGVIAGQLVVGTLAGVLFGALMEERRAPAPLVAGVIVGVLWLLSLGLLWPNLATNYAGRPPGAARVTTSLGLLVAYAAYGLVLVLGFRLLRGPLGGKAPAGVASAGRRAVLMGGAGTVLAIATGALLRQFVQRATFSYDGTEYRGTDVQPITPNDRFYTVTKNIVDPDPSASVWRLEIGGLVDRPQTYDFNALAALPSTTTQETTLMCISNYLGGGLMSNAQWKGLPLRDLLSASGPQAAGTHVTFYGADGYTVSYSIDKAMEPTTFVAYEMNGAPLPPHHGYPARVLSPGLFGLNSVKWVTRIELVAQHVKGFYEQQGWGPSFVIPNRSTFFSGDFETPLTPGESIPIRGNAFAGNRGVASVDVSPDGGRTWLPARIDYPGTDLTWAFWTFDWRPLGAGAHTLVARMTDRQGGVQTGEYRDTAPQGATGYPGLHVRVTA